MMPGTWAVLLLATQPLASPDLPARTVEDQGRGQAIAKLLREETSASVVARALEPIVAQQPDGAIDELLAGLQTVREFQERRTCRQVCRVVARAIAEMDEATGTRLLRERIRAEGKTNPEWVADLAAGLVFNDAELFHPAITSGTRLASLADAWLAVAAGMGNADDRDPQLRQADIRLGTTLLTALTLADFIQARPRIASYRYLGFPPERLHDATARRADGSHEKTRLSLAEADGLSYVGSYEALPEMEPALLSGFAECQAKGTVRTDGCKAIARQLRALDSTEARKALAGIPPEPTEAEVRKRDEMEGMRAERMEHLKLGLATFGGALLLSASGVWQLVAWQDAQHPTSARTPLTTVNTGLTFGFVLGSAMFVTSAVTSSRSSQDGLGRAWLSILGGAVAAGVGIASGAGIGYWQRDNRVFYQSIAISQIVWPLLLGLVVYTLGT
jgi:hypothetical protein